MKKLPPSTILHIPHDSLFIPENLRRDFLLTDELLELKLLEMTDRHTLDLYGRDVSPDQIAYAQVSRLVVDVERFDDDAQEPMSRRGMGVVYTATHDQKPLRHAPDDETRQYLLDQWYRPHHRELTRKVDMALNIFGKALLVDCHSYPSEVLPYELDQDGDRPEICIGTDSFHTPPELAEGFQACFEYYGFEVGLDSPFSGSLVPLQHYHRDERVRSVMIEVRRDLYMDEITGEKLAGFDRLAGIIRECLLAVSSD